MPSAVLDAFVRAIRERDNKYGQAAKSPMVRRDLSKARAPTFVPLQLKTAGGDRANLYSFLHLPFRHTRAHNRWQRSPRRRHAV